MITYLNLEEGSGRNDALYRLGRSLKAKNIPADAIRNAIVATNQLFKAPLSRAESDALIANVLTQADRAEFHGARRGGTETKQLDVKEAPRPLFRATVPGEAFPTAALGAHGAAAALELHCATQAHPTICGQSVLAAMNLAVMGHVDIEPPYHDHKPTSEYFATIAESGARKTSADNRATMGIVEYQNEHDDDFRREYFEYKNDLDAYERQRNEILAWKPKDKAGRPIEGGNLRELRKEKLDALGEAPEPPVTNIVLVGADPTYEGLYRFFREGGASIAGQFTSEGGALVGGHSMSDEARLRTVAGLSQLWDGTPLPRVRGSESHSQVRDRRVAMHILIQPRIGGKLYVDPDLNDQGFLTRVLTTMQETNVNAGSFVPPADYAALRTFNDRTKSLLERPFPYRESARPREGVRPRAMTLDAEATALWIDFYNEVQAALIPGGRWFPIKGFAAKAPEHAVRLAATRAEFDDPGIEKMGAEPMRGGITLTKFFWRSNSVFARAWRSRRT